MPDVVGQIRFRLGSAVLGRRIDVGADRTAARSGRELCELGLGLLKRRLHAGNLALKRGGLRRIGGLVGLTLQRRQLRLQALNLVVEFLDGRTGARAAARATRACHAAPSTTAFAASRRAARRSTRSLRA